MALYVMVQRVTVWCVTVWYGIAQWHGMLQYILYRMCMYGTVDRPCHPMIDPVLKRNPFGISHPVWYALIGLPCVWCTATGCAVQ